MITINGKEYRNLQEQVQKNMEDINELKIAVGTGLTAGTGIDIEEEVISVNEDVAMKTDLDYDNLSNKPDLTEYAKLNDDTQTITAASVTTTPGAGYIHTTYGPSSISMSIPRTPGYTLNIPTKDGTLATTGDIPTYTAGTGIDITNNEIGIDNTVALKTDIPNYTGGSGITINSGNVVSADSTLARVADIPSITGLTMYNYKITISGVDGGTSNTRSAVYIVSLPYQWDYSSLTAIQIIRLIPVWSVVVDTDTSAGNKNIGRFHWQTSAISLIDWVDGTHTVMDFTGQFNATITAAAPAHW